MRYTDLDANNYVPFGQEYRVTYQTEGFGSRNPQTLTRWIYRLSKIYSLLFYNDNVNSINSNHKGKFTKVTYHLNLVKWELQFGISTKERGKN